jgi:hypothetical protein
MPLPILAWPPIKLAVVKAAAAVGSSEVTLRPKALSWSDPELSNPQRGAYRWYGQAPEPKGWPARDTYYRYSWRLLEPSEGVYNWSPIDNELLAVERRGGKLGMRVMSANSWDGGSAVPDYLMKRMAKGFWFTYPDNGNSVYAPDWNNPDYMKRAEALIQALAKRYAGDNRFGWIEIGPYGDFGEWHVGHWPYDPSPSGATDMTLANRQRLIDLHVDLFPPTKLIQMIDSATGKNPVMDYALGKSPLIGIREDCLGSSEFDSRMHETSITAQERWKTAPIIAEYCGVKAGSGQFARGKEQVVVHHVSLLEGNHDEYRNLSEGERSDFNETRQRAGYRLRLESMTRPSTVSLGSWMTIASVWENDGSAPTYSDWDVLLQFRDPENGTTAWQGRSTLELRSLLPTTDPGVNAPVTVIESYPIGRRLAPGSYDVVLTIRDPSGYSKPLELAMQGRGDDGSYHLGSIVVTDAANLKVSGRTRLRETSEP